MVCHLMQSALWKRIAGRYFRIHLENAATERAYLTKAASLRHLILRPSLSSENISSSHPLILSSSHPLILSSSHPLILSSSHPLILSSSHPLILSSPLLIFSSPPVLLSLSSPSGISFQKQFIHLFSRKPDAHL
ncbi:hypothetical protein NA56DRAFT_199245 [Hyaloscypha hepaticicola]|uniref:Uncharacterized protein n=1 Tax=Hyaloscypha hepaticicola TaxID=2082293 RepID=A0A2J6Q0E8_9HELO|nr:hypothetical protein NA56DRAFT_199245 [Hyaloscypha hepaticicola]